MGARAHARRGARVWARRTFGRAAEEDREVREDREEGRACEEEGAEGEELRLQRARPQRPDAHAAAALLPRARERGARAREPREALVHPAHGAVRGGRAVVKSVALRVSLIWHDEVMEDLVLEKPAKITIGSTGKPTFV